MKAMLSAFVVMGLISIGAYYGLKEAGYSGPASGNRSGDSVRLD